MGSTKGDHATGEAEYVLVRFQTAPVVPARFVVLAVGVVVAALRAAKFVPAEQHRHAARDQQRQQEVLDLAFPDGVDLVIGCVTFRAVILGEILGRAVVVVLTVRFIVLLPIAHEILQREAVVTGDEIDARVGAFAGLGVDVGAAADALGEHTKQPIVAAPEPSHVVAVLTVPLRPAAVGEAPDLIRSGGIPRLGNELHIP